MAKPGKPKNASPSKPFTVTTTPQVMSALRILAKVGLHGKNPSEVADRLISEALMSLLERDNVLISPYIPRIQFAMNRENGIDLDGTGLDDEEDED